MSNPKGARRYDLTDDDYVKAFEASFGKIDHAAAALGVNAHAVRSRLNRMRRDGVYDFIEIRDRFRNARRPPQLRVESLPEEYLPVEELVAIRRREYQQKRAYEEASRLVRVKVNVDGPIGILHFGDPHLDDDGTDIGAIEDHSRIVRETPGLFAASLGDMTNNWIGRLAKLYAEQSTSASQAWQLAEWFVSGLAGHWLYLVAGNHDLWSGSGDPIKWITRRADALYKASECRLELQLPNGQRPRINARHDFVGHSMWNPAHGPMKALHMGVRDHVAVCGDRHISAYSVLKCPESGITMHAIRVATYKIFDRYAQERGFRDQNLSPCVVTVINTGLPDTHPDYVKVFWQPREGADYLNFLRKQPCAKRSSSPRSSQAAGRRTGSARRTRTP